MSNNPSDSSHQAPAYSGQTDATKNIHLAPAYNSDTLASAALKPPAPAFKPLQDRLNQAAAYQGA